MINHAVLENVVPDGYYYKRDHKCKLGFGKGLRFHNDSKAINSEEPFAIVQGHSCRQHITALDWNYTLDALGYVHSRVRSATKVYSPFETTYCFDEIDTNSTAERRLFLCFERHSRVPTMVHDLQLLELLSKPSTLKVEKPKPAGALRRSGNKIVKSTPEFGSKRQKYAIYAHCSQNILSIEKYVLKILHYLFKKKDNRSTASGPPGGASASINILFNAMQKNDNYHKLKFNEHWPSKATIKALI
ncbi:hypothetical protein FQA39_LY03924 [Lamprigera yunnana]|nr:hypothetical protein FQA39_LY03924 [Lamprigera yunnana]